MKLGPFLFTAGAILSLATCADAQAVPFFFGGATAFEPQISIVNSGTILDAQAVVSSDMKYVTLNMRPQSASLLALQAFTFQNGGQPMGIVGLPQTAHLPGANGKAVRRKGNNTESFAPHPTSAAEIKRLADSWVLEREGMFQIGDAK